MPRGKQFADTPKRPYTMMKFRGQVADANFGFMLVSLSLE